MMSQLSNPGLSSLPLNLDFPTDATWAEEFTSWWTTTSSPQRRGFYRQAAKVGVTAAWEAISGPWEDYNLDLDDTDDVEMMSRQEHVDEMDALERLVDHATDLEDDREA